MCSICLLWMWDMLSEMMMSAVVIHLLASGVDELHRYVSPMHRYCCRGRSSRFTSRARARHVAGTHKTQGQGAILLPRRAYSATGKTCAPDAQTMSQGGPPSSCVQDSDARGATRATARRNLLRPMGRRHSHSQRREVPGRATRRRCAHE